MQKTLVVVGVTGNQGGSVAERFLQDPQYHVRGLTRDPTSDRAQQLAGQGIEMVQATLDDVESLRRPLLEPTWFLPFPITGSPSFVRTADRKPLSSV